MTTAHETFNSPLSLLGEWQARADAAGLRELLLLGYTINLPFLEKVAIPMARAMGARITVVGDAAMGGQYDPIDVRMAGSAYLHGNAACGGAFHPKLAVLIGERDVIAAVGSGNPTMAGWGYNDELWTVLRGRDTGMPVAILDIAEWLWDLDGVVPVPGYISAPLEEIGDHLAGLPVAPGQRDDVRVLQNLHTPLLDQLPKGPTDELCLYAPFIDVTGDALGRIVDHFDPARVVLGVQERWTSYDGNAIVRALAGRDTELRRLAEQRPRHGKLLEWSIAGARYALTGSANLTRPAMLATTASDGNCELGVLAPTDASLLPEATAVASVEWLRNRRTVRPVASRPTLFLLGAVLTSEGLHVTLARASAVDVLIETSPDGSPGSWQAIGKVPAGRTEFQFAVPELAGTVVRARIPGEEQATSPAVFAAQPIRAGHRLEDDNRPRMSRAYTEEEIFTDEELGRRFRKDLMRLAEQLSLRRARASAVSRSQPTESFVVSDRYGAYLEECERTVGLPLTSKLFGRLITGMFASPTRPAWGVDVTRTVEENTDDPEPEERTDNADSEPMLDEQRAGWRKWCARAVAITARRDQGERPVLVVRMLIARLFVQLLGHGVWDFDDDSWRPDLARLTQVLSPSDADDAPEQSYQHVAALTAVCMGLLARGAELTGSTPKDIPAVQTWRDVRHIVAEADVDLADDLLLPASFPHAHVLSKPALEDLVWLARAGPTAPIEDDLRARGWKLERLAGIYRVTGAFNNPIPVAARVATLLADHFETAVVYAVANGHGAVIAWRRPELVLASAPRGYAWRVYRLNEPATPESHLSGGGEGLPKPVDSPVPLRQAAPEAAWQLLKFVGIDPSTVVRMLTNPAAAGPSVPEA